MVFLFFFLLVCTSAQLLSPLPVSVSFVGPLVVDFHYCLLIPVFSVDLLLPSILVPSITTYIDGKRVEEGTLLRVIKVLVQLLLPDDASRALFI